MAEQDPCSKSKSGRKDQEGKVGLSESKVEGDLVHTLSPCSLNVSEENYLFS